MKLKTTLKRPPWRRKKTPQTRDVGLAQSIGRLIKPRSQEDPPAPAAARAVDPSVYNELVTPRDPALGMGTPDKSHIVYTSRPVVLVCPASDDDPDDDEFGEVQPVPITLYYDAQGDVIEDRAWAGLCGSWCRNRGRGGGQSRPESGSESEADYRECLGRLKARSWVEGRYMRNYGEEKMSSEGPVSCYWGGREALKVREVRGAKGKAAKAGVGDGEEASVGRSHSERPIPARSGDGRSVWEARGRSLVCRYPPGTAHYPHMTSRRTSCHSDPQDVIWSSMCAMYPGVAWEGVGGMGGAGEGVWVDPGEAHQYGGTRVATRADPRTPGPVQDSAGNRRRQCRARDKQSHHHRHLEVSEDTKLWCRTGERVAYDWRTRGPGMPSMDQLVERPGCGGGARQCAAQRGLTPAGTTLPGHAAFAHNLTHIDYDNLRPAWPRKEEAQGFCGGVERRRDAVPHTSSAPPSSDDSSHCHHRHREPRLGPRSSAGDLGRRGEGAWPGGPRVQASGTCGALGQAGPESPVSARTLPRAHARSRHTCSSSSVLSENSVSSESSGVGAVSEDSQSVGDTSVRVNIGDCESWWWYQDGVCEGECTCDMPCKVSGIPVYQGRGGDPPRHSREDVPPAAPPAAAGGRGRGAGRRNVGSKASVTNSSRSPALLGRRSSFGPQGLSRGGTAQDSEVDPQSRTSPSGGGQHNTNHSDHTRGAGASSHRPRASPSPSTRSPARGTSPGLGIRPPSPAAAGRTSTTMRRRESQGDPRTPPVTPSSRRPPPRAVYQVKLSSGASSRDSPPMHRDKSKLPVIASKSIKNDTSQGAPRTFPPRPGAGRVPSGQRPGKDTVKDREGVDDGKYVEQAGQTSLKLDTPPKSLPLSLSVNSPVSPEAKDDGAGGKTFVDVGGASGTAVIDSDATPNRQSQTSGKTPPVSRTKSSSFLPKAPSPQEKPSGLLRPGSNRLTSSASRLTSGRRNTGDTSRPSDSKLDRTLSVSSTHITPKVSVTRTYSGPKSSLADGANRARIVRRVMNGSRTNLSKKKSSSKTSLVVGRHNIYNRSKSGSKSSLLGSRNNLFRASLDSQRTESTTDSGCNSPMYGSQCSLDGDRKRHSSSPCPNLRKRVGSSSFVSMISRSDSERTNNKDRKTTERRVESTPPSLPVRTPDPSLPGRPERDTQATIIEPDAVDRDIGTDTKSDGSVTETRVCEADAAGRKVKTLHSRYFSGSNLVQKMQKPSVPVKRSSSLQIPSRSKPAPPPKPSPSGLRASSSSLICGNVEGEGKENRPLPGISVSFRSVSSRQPHSYGSYKGLARNNEKEIASQDKREITKVSIVAEPKTKEEKGIQVEASSSEEDADEDEYDLEEEEEREEEEEEGDGKEEEEEEKEMITSGGSDSHRGQTEGVSSARSQVRYDGPRNSSQPLPGPFRARDGQPTPERAGRTLAHISVDQEKGRANVTEKMECRSEIEDNRNNEKKASLGDEENHIIQRLETSLADIIDSAVLKNLKINGNILADQFDAIIATLKKVAASVDSGDSADSPPLNRRNSDGGVRAAPKTPVSPTTPLTATPVSTSSSSPMSPLSPSTPRSPPSKTPLSLFSISECYPGHAVASPTFTKNRKLSLPRDSLQDNSPTLAELARRLHANPNHLRADQDYVDFMDLDQPYVSPAPAGVSTSDLIRGEPTPKSYGRKNSTGSLGLSSCASLLQDKSYYAGGPTTTASVTNLNSSEDYAHLFGPRQSAFRKVHSTSNVNGAVSGGSHRMFQRHLSLCGPDDVRAENRLRKSLSKSRELLSQLENEYKRIKGDESKSARNSLIIDQSWLDKDFDELLQTLSNDKTIQSDPHETLAFLANSGGHHSSSSCASSSSKSDKWRGLKKDAPQLPMADSPRARRHQSVAGTEGRHIFSFFQKKGRSQSLTGTEAIKIALPMMPEYGPQDGDDAQGPPRVTYESATLDRPGRTNRSNSIPLGSPHALGGSGLPLDLVGIFKKNRSKSLSKPASAEEEGGEDAPEDEEGQQEEEEVEGEDEPAKQMRSLSLPKSFLSDKYGLTGFKAALPSVIFPWRRSEHSRSSGRSSPAPYDATSQLPATSPSCSQSPSCAHPADSANSSSCEVASEPKRKDGGVWWRGRAGVSRTTRREKASSSPVFRRASLSHSEWDIRRPWSHVYSEREAAKLSQSVCRLAMTSVEDGGVPGEVVPEGEGPRSLPYMPSNMQSSTEGMFQKFKKSLSLRLAKKGSRSESPSSGSHSAPIDHTHSELTLVESQTLPRRRGSITRDDDNKTSFLFGHPLFRSSKERRRARLKDVRSSKCNSGDSGDSGIELVTTSGQVTSLDMTSHSVDLDGGTYVDPAFMASLAEDGGSSLREVNPRTVRRTHSDVGGAGGRGCVHYSRQLSTPQPIKIRPAHRLPQHTASLHRSKSLKRSKGSSHLRRSVSQPLDLDRAYDTPTSTLRKCRSPSNTSNRRQRRPSAGNILNEDNTTSEDEIGMSDSEDFRTDLKRSLEEDDDMIVYAEALWDHVTLDSEELVFKAGDLITVIDSSDKDWWWGRISHRAGWFPAAFVRILVNQEDHLDSRSHDDARLLGPARKLSISGLSHDQIRTNVINEIISTERDFVKHLRDVVKGYLRQVRKRPDMFSDERISTIFGNMEALYQFQSNFLRELEMCIDWQDPHKSCIGAAFTRNREKFEIYSEYCNNHPAAMSSLQELYQDQKYIHFFEACRLLQEMIDISLDGFLLTPVQKICKYPLQLQELLKYTKPDHPDYSSVQGALEAMRDVALLVNERKRRMECLEKIASWQITVEGWEGPELLEDSSQLIYQGEVTKGVGGSWPKDVTLFLFDHQLVYCKRDLLKRNTFVYRGRLNLDVCEIVDLPDGKDSSLNISVHNGWKIHSLEKNKWYVFSCKTATEKHKWMEAFRKERKLVAADESAGFVVAEKAKHLAKVAARNQRNRPKRPRSLWFSFGGHKKGRGSGRNVSQTQHHPV